jgi:hypothetical protein
MTIDERQARAGQMENFSLVGPPLVTDFGQSYYTAHEKQGSRIKAATMKSEME